MIFWYIFSAYFLPAVRFGIIDTVLANKWVERGIITSMIVVVGMILFTPNYPVISKFAAHAFEAVLLFIGSAMAFMILKKPKIMYTCLAMGAVLSVYLKAKSNSGIISFLNKTTDNFTICQVLINSGADQYDNITTTLLQSDADIIQIQEITPDWLDVLKNSLEESYKYHAELNRIDPYGMVIYSKFPIFKIDTLLYADTISNYTLPALQIGLDIRGKHVDFIACHMLPRLNTNDFNKVQEFLTMITGTIISNTEKNIIFSGELGLTPWDYALQKMINESGMQLSRREPHLFVQPFEHILYTNSIECHWLKEVLAPGRNHIGIQGEYSFSKPVQ